MLVSAYVRGKYCPSCISFTSLSQGTRDVRLPSTQHGVSNPSDLQSLTGSVPIYTVTVLIRSLTAEPWNVCLFERRIWFCLLLECCLCVSSTTNGDPRLFIWRRAQTFDLSKWVANPCHSYCGTLVVTTEMLPPSGLEQQDLTHLKDFSYSYVMLLH